MSNTVDDRVLSMEFDNSDFERNVSKSIKSLDALNQSIDATANTKGFSNLSKSMQSVDISSLITAVESIQNKFSALGIIGVTALQNITNQAIATGERLVKSLTVDQITQGYEEYELKMNSVQTIMAGTGESLETVSDYLEELNKYADKTIYSFSDMTSNIGKFTNAGVKLESAVKAIQGVSNVAAVSGANAQEASRAMYNFAQALSAGYVKLIDWKSIENANMATVEFKQQLIDTAVAMGTVKKTADGYVTTTTDAAGKVSAAFDATHNFNDALSNQWMTTEVLTKTLENYTMDVTEMTEEEKAANRERLKGLGYTEEQIDKIMSISTKANKAATEVKTFTQLMDTLKESVGSSWATTSELIIGDFEEAKALYTDINDIIGGLIASGNDARNEVLKGWKEFGGREILIKSLGNAFNNLMAVLKPIKEAFREIFPATTSAKLLQMTMSFQQLTERLKPSEEAIDKIKRSFKGLFAIFGIIKQALETVGTAAVAIAKHFGFAGSSVLDFTAIIGDYLSSLQDTIKQNNIFGKAIITIVQIISSAVSGIKAFVSVIKTALVPIVENLSVVADKAKSKIAGMFGALKADVNFDGLSLFAKLISISVTYLGVLKDKLKEVGAKIHEVFSTGFFTGLVNLLTLTWNVVTTVGKAIFGFLGDIFSAITNGLGNANFDSVFDIIDGLLSSGILIFLTKASHSLSELAEPLGSLGDILEGFNMKIKAEALMKIAISIAVLAASLLVLSGIDSAKLAASISVMTAMFAELMASLKSLSGLKGDSKSLSKLSTTMLAMSVSIFIMASAMKKLASIETGALVNATVAITALTGTMVIAMQQLSKINAKKMTSTAAAMVIFAVAVNTITKAVRKFGEMNPAELTQGLIGLGVVLAELDGFMALVKFGELSASTAFGLLEVAAAAKILASVVQAFGQMEITALAKGVIALGVVLASLAAFTKLASGAEGMITTGLGMIAIATAITILTKAVSQLAQLSVAELAKGLIGMAVALAAVTAAMYFMPITGPIIGVGMIAMAAGITILAQAMTVLGAMDLASIGKALLALGGGLAIIAVAMNLMILALPGAAAMLVVSAALTMFVPQLLLLGSMDLASIGKALLALAGGFTIVGLAGLLLAPIIPSILGVAAAVALLGAGVGVGAAGLALLSTALLAFAAGGTTAATAIVAALAVIIEGVAKMIPTVLKYIGEGIVELAKILAVNAPVLVATLLVFLDDLLTKLDEYVPKFVAVALHLLIASLQAINDNMAMVMETALNIIANFILGIANGLDDVIDAAVKLVISFIDGMATAIDKNNKKLIEAVDHLMSAIWNAMKEWAINFVDIGAHIIDGIKEGLGNGITKIKEKAAEVGTAILDKFKSVLGIHSPSTKAKEAAEYVGDGVVEGLEASTDNVENASESLADKLLNTFKNAVSNGKSSFSTLGDDIINSVSGKQTTNWSSEDQKREDMKLAQQMQANSVMQKTATVTEKVTEENTQLTSSANSVTTSTTKEKTAVEKLAESLQNSLSIFTKFNKDTSVNSSEMLSNMQSNYTAVTTWVDNLKNLASRGIDTNLLQELVDLGLSGSATVKTFVEMTDDELKKAGTKYSKTFSAAGEASLKTITDYIETGKQQFKSVYESADYVAANTADVFKKTKEAYKELAKSIGESLDPFTEYKYNTETTAKSVEKLTKAMGSQTKKAKLLQKSYAMLATNDLNADYINALKSQAEDDQFAIISALVDGDMTANIKKINKSYNKMLKAGYTIDSKVLAAIASGNMDELTDEMVKGVKDSKESIAKEIQDMYEEAAAELDNTNMDDAFENFKTKLSESISMFDAFEKAQAKSGSVETFTKNLNDNSKAASLAIEGWLRILGKGFSTEFVSLFQDLPINEQLAYIKDILENTTEDNIEELTKAFTKKAEVEISDSAKTLSDSIESGTSKVTDSMKEGFDSTYEEFDEELGKFTEAAENIIPSIGENITSSLDAFTARLAESTGNSAEAYTSIATEAFRILGENAVKAAGEWDTLTEAMANADDASTATTIYYDTLNQKLGEMRTNLTEVISSQMDLFSKFNDKAEVTGDDMLENMRSQIDGIKNWQKNLDNIADRGIGQGLLQKLAELGPNAYETVAAFADMTSEQLEEATKLFEESLTLSDDVADNIMSDYAQTGSDVADGFINGVREKATEIQKAASETSGDFLETLTSSDNLDTHSPSKATHKIGVNVSEGLANGIKSGLSKVRSAAKSLSDGIKNSLSSSSMYNDFYSIGSYVAQGLANGIRSGRSRVISAAIQIAVEALDAAKKELEVESPSKKFQEVGYYSAIGFAKGISDNSDKAADAATDMASDTYEAMNSAISKVAEMVSGEIDANPTITPVLDLSNVKKGVNVLNGMMSSAATSASGTFGNTNQNGANSGVTFIQNNYSPKALNRIEIYRQTKNQFAAAKGLVNA